MKERGLTIFNEYPFSLISPSLNYFFPFHKLIPPLPLAITPAERGTGTCHRSSPSYRPYSFPYVRGKFAPFNVEIITRRIKISSSHSFMAERWNALPGRNSRHGGGQKKNFQPPSPVITMRVPSNFFRPSFLPVLPIRRNIATLRGETSFYRNNNNNNINVIVLLILTPVIPFSFLKRSLSFEIDEK